ncbi:PHP domain-containing protein, partial [Klebsiella pneumoniae]
MSILLNADLHCHSVVSDGTLTPEALAARAHANGVALWALTDHDE